MSYQPKAKHLNMTFDDYPGLHMTCTTVSISKMLEVSKYADVLGTSVSNIDEVGENAVKDTFSFFADRIVSWDVTHPPLDRSEEATGVCSRCGLAAGADMKPTVESLMCLDLTFVMNLFNGWAESLIKVADPKGRNLSNGEPNTLEQEVMRRLANAQSLLKSPTQN